MITTQAQCQAAASIYGMDSVHNGFRIATNPIDPAGCFRYNCAIDPDPGRVCNWYGFYWQTTAVSSTNTRGGRIPVCLKIKPAPPPSPPPPSPPPITFSFPFTTIDISAHVPQNKKFKGAATAPNGLLSSRPTTLSVSGRLT